MEKLLNIGLHIWQIYLDVAVYMLLGFAIAGILHVFFKSEQIQKHLGKGKIKPVFLSALWGIPIPLCSCGVVPVAVSLKKQGANSGAALSFMIATPESGVDSIAVSWALLDPVMTVARPVAGFITAVATGIAQNIFGTEPRQLPEFPIACGSGCGCGTSSSTDLPQTASPTFFQKLITGMDYAFKDLLGEITRPFLIGILIAGAITLLIPENLSVWAQDHTLLTMILMLAAGIPMYVCATSSTPIAAALILKGISPGAALVFLLAGPATNTATISIVRHIFNGRALIIYLLTISACAIGLGLSLDGVYHVFQIQPSAVAGQAEAHGAQIIKTIGAVALFLLILRNTFYNTREHKH